jgi:hypothetical protein
MQNAILKLFENPPVTHHDKPAGDDVIEAVDHVIEAMDAVIELTHQIAAVPVGRRRIATSRWLH